MFTLNGDIVTVTTPSDCRWLQVEFQPHGGGGGGGEGDKEEESRKIKVPATGNMVSSFCAAVFVCLVFLICIHSKNHLVMFNVPLLQLLSEVKQRAVEELQLQEQLQGKLLVVKTHRTFFATDFPVSSSDY